MEKFSITYITDVDREVFSNLNDKDLIKSCNLTYYTRNTVCDSVFWTNRLIKKFGFDPKLDNPQEAYRILSLGRPEEIVEYIITHGNLELYDRLITKDNLHRYSNREKFIDLAIKHKQYGILERLVEEYQYSNGAETAWYKAREYQDPIAAGIALEYSIMSSFDEIFYWEDDVIRYGTPELTKLFFERIEKSRENLEIHVPSFICRTLGRDFRYELARAAFEYILDYNRRMGNKVQQEVISLFLPAAILKEDLGIVYKALDLGLISEYHNLNDSLEAAANIGDIKLFDRLADSHWNNASVYTQRIPLESALISGNISVIEYAYENTPHDALSNYYLNNMLYGAIYRGNVDVAYFLIDKGASVVETFDQFVNSRGALIENVTKNNQEIVKLILEEGYDISKDKEILRIAANENNFPMAKILLEYGAPPILYKKIDHEMYKLIKMYK